MKFRIAVAKRGQRYIFNYSMRGIMSNSNDDIYVVFTCQLHKISEGRHHRAFSEFLDTAQMQIKFSWLG